ncbi:hypothetical protein M1563_00475 [Patescibacteria group bacterium]|nr:hypothetical protein [Patescibacteria group bacterium]
MQKVKPILIILGVLILLGLIFFALLKTGVLDKVGLGKYLGRAATIASNKSDLAFLNSQYPVSIFMGKIEQISGDTLTVSQQMPTTTGATKQVTYHITVTPQTKVQRPNGIPGVILPTQTYTIQDLKVGETITVNTNQDLRNLLGDTFIASTIDASATIVYLSGTITTINSDSFDLTVPPPFYLDPNQDQITQETVYQIQVNPQTTTTQLGSSGNKIQTTNLQLTSLKVGQEVMAFVNLDSLNGNKITALNIQPIKGTASSSQNNASTSAQPNP